jgi:hypothetical protein
MTEGYNGWKNRETWNVALWINNDEGLYSVAKSVDNYEQFREVLAEQFEGGISMQTPDGVAWNDSGIDVTALDEVIKDAHD